MTLRPSSAKCKKCGLSSYSSAASCHRFCCNRQSILSPIHLWQDLFAGTLRNSPPPTLIGLLGESPSGWVWTKNKITESWAVNYWSLKLICKDVCVQCSMVRYSLTLSFVASFRPLLLPPVPLHFNSTLFCECATLQCIAARLFPW